MQSNPRSKSVTDSAYHHLQEHREFVTFCLAVLYASTEELGWDASITRLSSTKDDTKTQPVTGMEATDLNRTVTHPRYIIDVRVDEQVTRRFMTISPISTSGAYGIIGRGTRVWEARELLDGGKESDRVVAIKDYWIDEDREREGKIVESIVGAAPDEAHRVKLKKHIVDILCHGDVYREHIKIVKRDGEKPVMAKEMAKNSTPDLTEAIKRRNCAIDLRRPKATLASTLSQEHQVASGTHIPFPPSSYLAAPLRKGRPLAGVRTRNRLVMSQVGTCLHNERSLRAVFSGLRDVCKGK